MKFKGEILAALLVFTMCLTTSVALDTKVFALCERNLSLNLSEDFHILAEEDSSGNSAGTFAQTFTIANKQSKGIAMLQIMDVYDEDLKLYGPDFITQSWLTGISMAASILSTGEDTGDRMIGNWTAMDSIGNSVTVNTIANNNSLMGIFGKTADVASWNIGDDRYAGLISSYDRNTTEQIIGTLVVN